MLGGLCELGVGTGRGYSGLRARVEVRDEELRREKSWANGSRVSVVSSGVGGGMAATWGSGGLVGFLFPAAQRCRRRNSRTPCLSHAQSSKVPHPFTDPGDKLVTTRSTHHPMKPPPRPHPN